MSDRQEI